MLPAELYELALALAPGAESEERLLSEVHAASGGSLVDIAFAVKNAWRESRAPAEVRLRAAVEDLTRRASGAGIALPGLIKKHGRDKVADAAGIGISLLKKLRATNPNDPRRLNEGHLLGWIRLDPAFDPKLEILRRADR